MHRLIEQFPLRRGAHPRREDGMCAMEMVAWLAGEPHSDEPQCACPVIASLVRACNDVMLDPQRTRYLRPLVPVILNSRATPRVERARGMLAVDALVRRLVPAVLRHRGRLREAEVFSALGPIVDPAHLPRASEALAVGGALLRSAQWVVDRAVEGVGPGRYVTGLVQFAQVRGDRVIWGELVELIERMAGLGRGDRQRMSQG